MKRNSTSMVDMEDKYHYINRCRYIYKDQSPIYGEYGRSRYRKIDMKYKNGQRMHGRNGGYGRWI